MVLFKEPTAEDLAKKAEEAELEEQSGGWPWDKEHAKLHGSDNKEGLSKPRSEINTDLVNPLKEADEGLTDGEIEDVLDRVIKK